MVIVVLIVALLAVVAVTLLDLVRVDLSMTGQTRKTFEARAVTDGALMEVLDDQRTPNFLPTTTSVPRQVISDPNDAFGTGKVTCPPNAPCSSSAFVRNTIGIDGDAATYSAELCLLRLGPAKDTGLETAQAVVYELHTIGNVNDGQTTSEDRAEAFGIVQYNNGTFLGRTHCH